MGALFYLVLGLVISWSAGRLWHRNWRWSFLPHEPNLGKPIKTQFLIMATLVMQATVAFAAFLSFAFGYVFLVSLVTRAANQFQPLMNQDQDGEAIAIAIAAIIFGVAATVVMVNASVQYYTNRSQHSR